MDIKCAQPERTRHFTGNMNIAFYGNLTQPFMAHWHSETEIMYVIRGTAFVVLDGTEYEVHAGQALIINSNVIHLFERAEPECLFTCVVFGEAFVFPSRSDPLYEKYFLSRPQKKFPAHITEQLPHGRAMLDIIRSLVQSGGSRPEGCELGWRCLLMRLYQFALVHRLFSEESKSENNSLPLIRSAILYIGENLSEPIRIDALAGQLGYSPEYFSRTFRAIVQESPTEYILSARMRRAEHLLTHTGDSIGDVAFLCGFNDLNYFSRCFRLRHHVTPGQYRKMYL